MNENGTKKVRVLISGTVQMVAFRHYTVKKARGLGLDGWVRNLSDKRVEAVFDGSTEKIDEMIEWCGDNEHGGSPSSEVLVVDLVTPPDADSPSPFDEWPDSSSPFEEKPNGLPEND